MGAAVGATSYLLTPFMPGRAGLVLAVAGVSTVAVTWPRARRWLPDRACQVSKSLLLKRSLGRAALRWGTELGLGVCTFVVTPAFYALLVVALGQRTPVVAASLCVIYGMVRGATIACFALVQASREAVGRDWGWSETGMLERALRPPLIVAIIASASLLLVEIQARGGSSV